MLKPSCLTGLKSSGSGRSLNLRTKLGLEPSGSGKGVKPLGHCKEMRPSGDEGIEALEILPRREALGTLGGDAVLG
jgi:hypothetical protein